MPLIKLSAAAGSDNDTTFNIVDSSGNPVNLTALGVTLVVVELCDGIYAQCLEITIDSSTSAVEFTGSVLTVKFGQLNAEPGKYLPKIFYISPTTPNGEVITGKGFTTVIQLTAIC